MPVQTGRKEVEMAGENKGKVTQVIGAVLDIRFDEGKLPEINEAIRIPTGEGSSLTVEVSQHLGDDTVRCIAMGSTDGLVRGMDAVATGAPISVPVGEKTLGRIFNVLGQPIDNKPAPEGVSYEPIHRPCLIRGFKEILEGRHDNIPESYFLNAGSIDDVLARV